MYREAEPFPMRCACDSYLQDGRRVCFFLKKKDNSTGNSKWRAKPRGAKSDRHLEEISKTKRLDKAQFSTIHVISFVVQYPTSHLEEPQNMQCVMAGIIAMKTPKSQPVWRDTRPVPIRTYKLIHHLLGSYSPLELLNRQSHKRHGVYRPLVKYPTLYTSINTIHLLLPLTLFQPSTSHQQPYQT